MSGIQRQFSITFEGLPSIRRLQLELEAASKLVPTYTVLDEIEDNNSAKPELREITLHFRWGTDD